MNKLSYPLIALALAGTAAHAQNAGPLPSTSPAAQPATTEPAPPASAATGPQAGAVTSAAVTDAEVDSFAQAAVKVQKISSDTALDQGAKQQQMAAAVTGAGLDPARFNQIAKAVPADSALRARVQTAMAKYAGPPQG